MVNIFSSEIGLLKTNCYIITSDWHDKAIIIDAGGGRPIISRFLVDNNKMPAAVLCTHGHVDHVLDAKYWQDLGAKIYIHKNDLNLFTEKTATFAGRKFNYPKTDPDVFVEDGDKIEFGEICFSVMHTPGHTNGSVSYLLNDKYIFTGDTLLWHSYGRTDLKGGNFDKIVDSIHRILDIKADMIVYPGHGENSTLREERIFNPVCYL